MKLFKLIMQKKTGRGRPAVVSQTESVKSGFHDQLADWRYDKYESQKVWLNRSLLGLGVLACLLLLSLITNVMLFPLKEKVPYLYAVNETTGELTQLGQFIPDKADQSWLMTRFLLVRYITNREVYDFYNLDHPYQIAWAMSDNKVANDYAYEVSSDNPKSPFATYGKNKYVTTHVLSVNRLNENTAEVRFEQTLSDRTMGTQQKIQKAAIVKWQYTNPVTTQKMLERDPLGFKVIYYQPTQVNLESQ